MKSTFKGKRKVCIILSALMAIVMAAGCSPNTTSGSSSKSSPETSSKDGNGGSTTVAKGEFPLTTEPITLKIWGKEHVNNDYQTNVTTTEYEKKTGVKVEWDLFSSSMDDNEAFNILIASGNYPDIISSTMNTERVNMCVEGKILIPLNNYIDSGSYYKDMLTEQPQFKDMVTAGDGNIYTFVYTDSGVHKDSEYKMWVYTEWLEKLKLSTPTTPEEFKEMLIAFKEKDPNGNGKADELPMVGYNKGRQNDPICYLMNPFELYRNDYFYINDSGEVKFVANTDGWRDGLRYLNDLFKSGLILEETYVQDKTQFQTLLNRPAGETIMGVFPGWYQGDVIDVNVLDWTAYQAIPPLKGKTGLQQTAARIGGNFNLNGAITTSCKNPEIAYRWMDWFLSDEGNVFTQFGAKDITYDASDIPAFTGTTPSIAMRQFDTIQIWNSGTVPRYDKSDIRYSTAEDTSKRNIDNTYALFSAAKIYEPYYVPHNIPDVVWCNDQDLITKRTDYTTIFNEYIGNSNTAFVVGTMDINNDADWQKYVDKLNSMELDDYLQVLETYYS